MRVEGLRLSLFPKHGEDQDGGRVDGIEDVSNGAVSCWSLSGWVTNGMCLMLEFEG